MFSRHNWQSNNNELSGLFDSFIKPVKKVAKTASKTVKSVSKLSAPVTKIAKPIADKVVSANIKAVSSVDKLTGGALNKATGGQIDTFKSVAITQGALAAGDMSILDSEHFRKSAKAGLAILTGGESVPFDPLVDAALTPDQKAIKAKYEKLVEQEQSQKKSNMPLVVGSVVAGSIGLFLLLKD